MTKASPKLQMRFEAKVLVPMVVIIAALLVSTMWVVNNRLNKQIRDDAVRALGTSDAVFQNSQKTRARNLQLRYENIPNEPRFRAACQLTDSKPLQVLLGELLNELDSEVIEYTTASGQHLAIVSRDPSLVIGQFDTNTA